MFFMGNPHPEKMVPPFSPTLPPWGLNSACDASALPARDTPEKNWFHKTEIEAAAQAPKRVAAASILTGVWGQFAPIITSNDFSRASFQIAILIPIKNRSGKIAIRFSLCNRSAIFMTKSVSDFYFQTGSRLKTGFTNEISDGR